MSKWGKISYLVCGLSIIVLFTARFILQGWVDYLYAPLIVSVLTFVAALAIDYKFYLEFLSMRTTKHGMNMGVLILLSLVLVVAVNYLGVRFDKTFDLTQEKINTLSDQSIEVVKNLKDDMRVMIFYKGKNLKERAREIRNDFRMYMSNSNRIKVDVIDANFDVERAKKYLENSEAFATVLEYKGKRALVQSSAGTPDRPVYQEADITSAMLKITRDKPMSIYFLTGHQEKDIDQEGLEGLKAFAESLRNDGYTVAKINLIVGDKLPEPPAVLAIVGPKTALTDKELEDIRQFAKNGGRLFLAADPGERHQIALLTKSFGIEYRNNYVVNEVAGTDEGLIGAVGFEFDPNSPVTKKLAMGRALAVFPFASELARAPDASGEYSHSEIVRSHPRAYHLNNPNANIKDPERRTHALAMTAQKDKFSMVVFGDSDFLSDVRIQRWVHLDLAMNAVAYLFDDEMNLTIRPKKLEGTQLQVTSTKQIMIVVAGVSLPLCLIVLSGLSWYRRRNL